jgi:hypothetical protein
VNYLIGLVGFRYMWSDDDDRATRFEFLGRVLPEGGSAQVQTSTPPRTLSVPFPETEERNSRLASA